MKHRKTSSTLQRKLITIVALTLTMLWTLFVSRHPTSSQYVQEITKIPSSRAYPNQEETVSPLKKKLVNLVPAHLPLKVKVNNIFNANWVRDFEVEVTNTSSKPIYLLEFFLVMRDTKSAAGNPIGIPLRYGRIELVDYATGLLPADVPIQPGESFTFKAPEANVKGWEKRKIIERRSEPRRLELIFVQLNFGDGTGFHRTDGRPVPRPRSQSKGLGEPFIGAGYTKGLQPTRAPSSALFQATLSCAGSFAAGNFFVSHVAAGPKREFLSVRLHSECSRYAVCAMLRSNSGVLYRSAN